MVLTGTVAQLTQQADYYLTQGKLEQAIAFCQQVLAVDAEYAPALQTMGRAFHCLGRLEEALTYYTNALQLEPNVAEIHANVGSLYAQQKDWETAIACYKKAITLNPQFAGAYRNLAKILHQLDQVEMAIDYWYQAAFLEPERATPEEHLNLGNALAQQSKFEAAIACYRNAIHLKPTFFEAYQNWAEVLRQQGKLDEAATCYRKAIELMSTLFPDAPTSKQNGSLNGSLKGTLNGQADSLEVREALITQAAKLQQIEAYCHQKNWQAAIALSHQIIQLQPSATAYKLLGNALQGSGQIAEAMNRYQQALALQPDWAEVFANLGSLYAQQQHWDQAIEHYRKAIDLKPDFAGAYRNLAKIWTQLENTQAFEDCWYHALRLEPDQCSPETHLNFGNSLFTQGQIDRAITCYRNAIQLAPNLAAAYQNLAEALTQKQDWQAANDCYRKAFELTVFQHAEDPIAENPIASESPPDSIPAAYLRLAMLYAQQQRWEDAIAHIQNAIQLDSLFAEAHWQLGQVFEQQGDQLQAADAFYQAVTIAPELADAQQHFDLANQLVQQGKVAQAVACYQQTLRQDASFVGAHHNLGEIFSSQQQWQAAIDHFRQAIHYNPQYAISHLGLARVFAQHAQWNEAIAHYQQVITLEPSYLPAQLSLGEILMQQERWHEAIACYDKITQHQPDRWDAFHAVGTAYLKLEQWEAANDAYAKAIALNPDFSWSHNNRGDVLIHLERWEEAATAFRQASTLNPDFHWSQFNLGEVLTRLQDWEGAIAAYRRALELQPDLPYVHHKLADALKQRAKHDLAAASHHYQHAIEQTPDDEQLYHKALDIKPNDADLYIKLGRVLERKGNRDGAIVFYQIAEQLNAKNDHLAIASGKTITFVDQPLTTEVDDQVEWQAEKQSEVELLTQEDSCPNNSVFDDLQQIIHLLQTSGLFNIDYYLEHYPDVCHSGLDPIEHYIQIGTNKGYNPNLLFETQYYLQNNPDVAAAGINPLAHFILFGAKEGRNPHSLFNTVHYLTEYPDVKAARLNPLFHYLFHGAEEGRIPWDIKQVWDIVQAPLDLKASPRLLGCLDERIPLFNSQESKLNVGIYTHSQGNFFMAEIADFIAAAFEHIGVSTVRLSEQDCRPDDLTHDVVVTPQEFFFLGEGKRWIGHPQVSRGMMVSVDQPHTSWFSRAFHFMRNAQAILDINVKSATFLEKLGLPVYYFPLGYLPEFEGFKPTEKLPDLLALKSLPSSIHDTLPDADSLLQNRPIDIVYVATSNQRRVNFFVENAAWLNRFHCFLHMPPLGDCLTKDQNHALDTRTIAGLSRRSKILLNIHRGEMPYFEMHRLMFQGLWQKTLVITEPCHDVPGLIPGKHFIACKASDMKEVIDWLLNTAAGREEAERIRNAGHEALKNHLSMDQIMRRILSILTQKEAK